MPDLVGTAYVRLRVISDGLSKDIKQSVQRGVKDSGLDNLGKDIGRNLDNDLKKTFSRERGREHSNRLLSGIKAGFRPFSRITDVLAGMIRKVFIGIAALPAARAGIALIAKNIEGLIGLVGFLGQGLTGLGLAGGAAFSAMGLALLPLFFGFKAFANQMKNATSGPFLDLRITLIAAKKSMDEIGRSVNRALVPSLNTALRSLLGLTALFKEMGAEIGAAVGDYAKLAAAALSSATAQERFRKIMQAGVIIFRNFASAAIELGDALSTALVAALPVALKFSRAVTGMVMNFRNMIASSAASGRLTALFNKMYESGRLVLHALGQLSIALVHVFSIAGDTAGGFFVQFDRWATRFRNFTESIRGRNRLRAIFKEANEVMRLTFGILFDIGKFLIGNAFDTGSGKGLVGFLRWIRENLPVLFDWVTRVETAIKRMYDRLKDPLTNLIRDIGKLFTLFKDSGALQLSIDLFGKFVGFMEKLIAIPGVREVLAGITTFILVLSTLKATGAVSVFQGVFTALSGIAKVIAGLSIGAMLGWAAALAGIGLVVYEGFKHWDVIKPLIDGVVEGLKRFGSGFIKAVKPGVEDLVESLKNFWEKVMKPLGKSIDDLAERLTGSDIAGLMEKLGTAIGKIVSDNLTNVANGINLLVTGIDKLKGVDWDNLRSKATTTLKDIGLDVDSLKTKIAGPDGLSGKIGGEGDDSLLGKIKRFANETRDTLNPVLQATAGFVDRTGSALGRLAGAIGADVLPAMATFAGFIREHVVPFLSTFAGVTGEVIGLLTDLVTIALEPVRFIIETLTSVTLTALIGQLKGLSAAVTPVIDLLIDFYENALKPVAGALLDGVGKSLDYVTARLKDAREFIKGLRGETDILKGAMDALVGALEKVRDRTVDLLRKIKELLDTVKDTPFGEVLGKIFNSLPNPLANGAIVTKPTVSLIGEAGREVVIPLTRPTRARQLAEQSGLTQILAPQGAARAATSSTSTQPLVGTINNYTMDPAESAVQLTRRLSAIAAVSKR